MSFDFEPKNLPQGLLTIKTPDFYISQPGAIKYAGRYLKDYGKKLLLVGGPTAISKVKEELEKSLDEYDLEYSFEEFSGFPSETNISKFAKIAEEKQADLIVGIGGGRVMDTVKAVGGRIGIPVGTIPTIAATCASWAAVTILYDDEGTVVGAIPNQQTPRVIIADTEVIVNAPERYLFAGIVDTLAKWYETEPNISVAPKDITLQQKILTSKIAYDTLTGELDKTIEDITAHKVTERSQRAVDAVIYLAGLVGSLNGVKFYGGVAHGFYNVVTGVPSTRKYLHGERVAFGLALQFVLQKLPADKLEKELSIFGALKQPVTLEQIGIDDNSKEEAVSFVADGVSEGLVHVQFLPEKYQVENVKDALFETDRIGREFLKKQIS
ncbi:iron-containing alcohol dehydrogenase family protein [Butyrivibrio sp. LC3010]|uniref:iron-containing alcohol dehydrogenase family protein n=1 Tax=Butyrivibrio sp. LC3010 TaxID=1280680 RepID=UPI0004094D81|nr:iron-containing alcohol dehydrogenase family protein [Butyrivibrio sp. LC3010]